jgi:MFS transporter, DHA1 family, tetracycline resistance protein
MRRREGAGGARRRIAAFRHEDRVKPKSPLTAVFLTVVIDLLGFGIVMPLLPRYAEVHGASGVVRGLLFASFSGMQLLFAPFWGRLSDRIGRRPVLLLGLFGSVLSYLLFAVAELTAIALPLLFVSRIAAGIFGATISTASATIADLTPPDQRGRGMALIGAAFGIGFTLGPVIGGLASKLSVAAPGLCAAGFSLLAFAYAWRNLPEPTTHRVVGRRGWRAGLSAALALPKLPTLLLLGIVATSAFAMFESTLSLLTARRFGLTTDDNGWLFGYVGLWLIFAQGMLVRRLMPRLGEVRLVQMGVVLLGGGLALVAWAGSVGALYAVVPVTVVGFAFLTPSLSSLVSRATPATTQGEVLGLYQSGLALARILGPLTGNALQDMALWLPYVAGGGALALAFVLALTLRGAAPARS